MDAWRRAPQLQATWEADAASAAAVFWPVTNSGCLATTICRAYGRADVDIASVLRCVGGFGGGVVEGECVREKGVTLASEGET